MPIKSPFPGLDPYLQMHWNDVHQRFIMYSSDVLQGELPEDLLSRVEERVYVESEGERLRAIAPDTRIVEWKPTETYETETAGSVAPAESRVFMFDDDETTEGFIEIREANGDRVITIIEFLSPSNKGSGVGASKYKEKQDQVLQSSTNLVEIDLVRGGQRVFAMPYDMIPYDWRNDALAVVRKTRTPLKGELFRLPLRQPLRPILIPLRPGEKPVILDLQAIHDECYRKGRYDRLNYAIPLAPPLEPADAAWAASIISGGTP